MTSIRPKRLLRRDLSLGVMAIGAALLLAPRFESGYWLASDPFGDRRRVLICCGLVLLVSGFLGALDLRKIWSAQVAPGKYSGPTMIGLSGLLMAGGWHYTTFKGTLFLGWTLFLAASLLLGAGMVRIRAARMRDR